MCGINGLIELSGSPIKGGVQIVSKMNDLLAHRGPDDQGVNAFEEGRVVLGHRRLSIIDLSAAGHQPMSLPDGTTLVFNGEVFNYRELRSLVPDFDFKSGSDSETILALYQEMGTKCVHHFVGMYAFAIWDPHKKKLFLVRDRIGKKPLYYVEKDGKFAFSSEVRALAALDWVPNNLDEKALYYYLTFGFTPPPQTMFEGIQKLEEGHSLVVDFDRGVGRPHKYWSIEYQDLPDNESAIAEKLSESMRRSVDLRMVSDVPVGLFLSGGVDSSAIAASMRERTDQTIHSFSISFADQPEYDEADSARATAERYGFVHHERVVTQEDMRKMISSIVDVFDEPLADPTCVPIYFLSEMAKDNGIKVVLTGDGPDELMLGYRNWQRYQRLYPNYRRYLKLPKLLRTGGYKIASRFLGDATTELLRRAAKGQELFWGNAPSFKEDVKSKLLSKDFADRCRGWDCHDVISKMRNQYDQIATPGAHSDANWMAYIGLKFVIPNYYLHRADRLGMKHSIELRTPFLDHDFVNLSLSIPDHWKVRNSEPKYIFKKMLEPTLPKETLYAKKRGFCVPLREWGSDIMESYLNDRMSSFCKNTGLFDEAAMRKEIKNGNTTNMWNLFFIVNWFERWMNK